MSTSVPSWASSTTTATLVVEGQATGIRVWTARTRQERNTGLLGTDDLAGSLWITRCNWVHTVGMRYSIDVVYLTGHGRVISVRTMRPGRIGLPRLRAAAVLELPSGWASETGINRGAIVAATTSTP